MGSLSSADASHNPYAANIRKYYVFMALLGFAFGLIIPIWLIYLVRGRGLTLSEALLIEAIFWISQTISEVPTGVVADTYGRKVSILCGVALVGMAMALWTSAATIPLLILTYVIWGVGQTFFSGAQDAFLYESVKAAGRTEEYTRVTGRAGAINLGASALGHILCGPLAAIALVLPIVLCALMFLAVLAATLTFKEPPSESKPGREGVRRYRAIIRDSLVLIRARPSLRYALLYMTLLPAIFFILQIYFLQPQSLVLGVPLVAIGAIALAVQIANMIGMARADQIRKRFGARQVLYFAPLILIASLILLGIFQVLPALVFIVLIGVVSGVIRPLILNVVQNEVQDDVRATVLSMQSLMTTLFQVAVIPALGLVADHAGLSAVYFALAGILGVFLVWLVAKGRVHFPRLAVQP